MSAADVTAVMLTIGEPTFERARESVLRQTHPVRDVVVVENVHPFHRAFNDGAARVRTPFFVQVDADMVLDDDCVAQQLSRFADGVGSVVCHLRDALYGRVEGIKMYRTACVGGGQRDAISSDTDLHDRMARAGWSTVYALRPDGPDRALWHTFGEHGRDYTPFFAYARHVVDGRRWRHRGNAEAVRHHFHLLHRSTHPAGLMSHLALAHGLFLPGDHDMLGRYEPDAEFHRIVALLARDTRPGGPLVRGVPEQKRRLLHKFQLQSRHRDGQGPHRRGGFRDHQRRAVPAFGGRRVVALAILGERGEHIRRSGLRGKGGLVVGVMISQPPLVAADPLVDLFQRIAEGRVGVHRLALGLQRHTRRKVDDAVDLIAHPRLSDRHIGVCRAIEILGHTAGQFVCDAGPERISDIHVTAGDLDTHAHSPCLGDSKTA